MFCKHCGKNISENAKFCNFCGGNINPVEPIKNEPLREYINHKKRKGFFFSWLSDNLGKIIIIVIIGFAVIGGIYEALDEEAVTKNNSAIEAFDKGQDYQTTKVKLQNAVDESYSDDVKVNTLKNLAYVETTEGNNIGALANFKKALLHVEDKSLDYYIVSGEIALLEKNYNIGIYNFEKALEKAPTDFQVNNSLGVYYLDIEDEGHTNYRKALAYFKTATKDNPDSLILKENMAMAYFYLEDYDVALSLFLQTSYSTQDYLIYWIGLTYMGKEDFVNARIYLQKAVDMGMEVEPVIIEFLNSDL